MDWQVSAEDQEIFARELNSFVPDRLFDAHAHLYAEDQFARDRPGWLTDGPKVAGLAGFRARMDQIHPGRHVDGLFFAFPHLALDTDRANAFIAHEVRGTRSRGQMLIRPEMDPEWIRQQVREHGFVGLKCYHIYSPSKPTWEAPVLDYLPAAHVRIAHEERLSITLHMVRARAMADPVNQQQIRWLCERFPDMRMILAHAARGFNPHHTVEGIGALQGLTNVWCDTSAITDGGAIEAIGRTLGASRILYGSDFPVTHLRTRCVALGDSFLWLTPENTRLDASYGNIRIALAGIEELRALKLACLHLGLNDSEVEAVFHGNAAELFPE